MNYRVGIGYDIHRLVKGRNLFLGGIQIPYVKGLLGHSDGDVLLHAISDALLGALGEPDIGELFPNTSPKYHNIPSIELLKSVSKRLKKKGFRVSNLDTVVIAQEPRILPFKKKMQAVIARVLNIEGSLVNIKATTNEGIGEIGRKQAIASYAAVIINREG